MIKQIFSAIKVSTLAIILSMGILYAYAWTAPSTTPPTGNVSAPINTSAAAQSISGKLGVGMTTTPTSILEVHSNTTYSNPQFTPHIKFNDNFGGGALGVSGESTPANRISIATGASALTERLSINQTSGNVGIGTTAPTKKLDVAGDIVVNGITVGRGSGNANNVAIGFGTMPLNTTGYHNSAIGMSALAKNTTGYLNTAAGVYALWNNTTGVLNTAIGEQALISNTTGYWNTALGGAMTNNTTGYQNTASGINALANNTTGYSNTADGLNALVGNTTGYNNTAIGYGADVASGALFNATAVGSGAIASASNRVRIGNTAITQIGGQVAWSTLSDARQKENVAEYTHGLDFITKLRPVTYSLIDDRTKVTHSGFLAQEVKATNVPFYGLNKPANSNDFYSLNYAEFVVPLVNSVKELKAENDKLKADNEALIARIEKIEAMLK